MSAPLRELHGMKFSEKALLLYAVSDRAWTGRQTLADQIEQALGGGITCLQLREKNLPYQEFIQEIRTVMPMCRRYGVPLIINDSVDAALECLADGVHVGQSDMNARAVRGRIGPDMVLGVSVQTVDQAIQAQEDGADYLGVGAVFPTGTKPDADAVSYATLRDICAAVSIPVVAIGGISLATAEKLSGSGIKGIAVVSALFASPDIRKAAAELLLCAEKVCQV